MNENDKLNPLMKLAAGHLPFGEASGFGFETRLRAALGQVEPSLSESLSSFAWRFSFALLPVIIALAAFLTWQQHGAIIPQGMGEFVSHWAGYLPVEI